MNLVASYFILLFIFILVPSIQPKDNKVKIITDADYDSVLNERENVLLQFYKPWCSVCKSLEPEYEKLAELFQDKQNKLLIAKIDCDENPESCTRNNLQGFPTLKLFRRINGGANDAGLELSRDIPRTLERISTFLNTSLGLKHGVKTLISAIDILHSTNFHVTVENKCTLVKFYAPWCGSCKQMAPVYDQLAKVFSRDSDRISIADVDCTIEPDLCTGYKIRGYPTIKLFRKSKSPFMEYRGKRQLDEMVAFMNKRCGTARNLEGNLLYSFARTPALDELALQFMNNSHQSDREQIIIQVEQIINQEKNTYFQHYLTFMKRILEKGNQYVHEEYNRVKDIFTNKKDCLDPKKLDEFSIRLNILGVFTGKLPKLVSKNSNNQGSEEDSSGNSMVESDGNSEDYLLSGKFEHADL